MKLGFFWATLFWTPIFHHFRPFLMISGSPQGAKCAYYRGATHFQLFRKIRYFRPKCCFTEAPCTSVSDGTLCLTCFFEFLGAPPGAPERRMGGKCAYYRGATLVFHENMCFAEAKRTYSEPQGHVGTMLGHLASIIRSPGGQHQ